MVHGALLQLAEQAARCMPPEASNFLFEMFESVSDLVARFLQWSKGCVRLENGVVLSFLYHEGKQFHVWNAIFHPRLGQMKHESQHYS